MSIGAASVSEMPVAAQSPATTATKPPRTRQAVAKADTVAQPEPR